MKALVSSVRSFLSARGYGSRKFAAFLLICFLCSFGALFASRARISERHFEVAVDGMVAALGLYFAGNVGAKVAAKKPAAGPPPEGEP